MTRTRIFSSTLGSSPNHSSQNAAGAFADHLGDLGLELLRERLVVERDDVVGLVEIGCERLDLFPRADGVWRVLDGGGGFLELQTRSAIDSPRSTASRIATPRRGRSSRKCVTRNPRGRIVGAASISCAERYAGGQNARAPSTAGRRRGTRVGRRSRAPRAGVRRCLAEHEVATAPPMIGATVSAV